MKIKYTKFQDGGRDPQRGWDASIDGKIVASINVCLQQWASKTTREAGKKIESYDVVGIDRHDAIFYVRAYASASLARAAAKSWLEKHIAR